LFKPTVEVYEHLSVLSVNLKTKFENALLAEDVAQELYPKEMRGANVARVSAYVDAKDGNYVLSSLQQSKQLQKATATEQQLLFGDVSVQAIIKSLQQRGYDDIKLSESEYGVYKIEIAALQAIIHYCAQETKIELLASLAQDSLARQSKVRNELKQIIIENLLIL